MPEDNDKILEFPTPDPKIVHETVKNLIDQGTPEWINEIPIPTPEAVAEVAGLDPDLDQSRGQILPIRKGNLEQVPPSSNTPDVE